MQAITRLVVLFLLVSTLSAAPLLHPSFSDHMVLQRGRPAEFRGQALAGSEVVVEMAGRVVRAKAGNDGFWRASMELPPAGGPYEVKISGPETRVLHNVLVGDVWLCGGQSNMNFALREAAGGTEAVAGSALSNIRLYSVEARSAYAPEKEPRGTWQECSPETSGAFSAVAFFFARRLQPEIGVPVGLIKVALGGSPAESWMSAQGLARLGDFDAQLAEIARLKKQGVTPTGSFLMHWLEENDPGVNKEAPWSSPGLDAREWRECQLPGSFSELSDEAYPVAWWFRKEITLPDPLPEGDAVIRVGSVDKMDTTYINGQLVGLSSWVEAPRNHRISKGVLKPGKNLVAIRVLKTKKTGGFKAPAEKFKLDIGSFSQPLAGTWKAKLGFEAKPPHPLPLDWENYPTMPSVLFNGLVAPLVPLSVTGAIWYQGEANTERAAQYRRLMPALIEDWRETFGQGDFPFLMVGLPAFMGRRMEPSDDGWARLRAAQLHTTRVVRNTELVSSIDTGEAGDIHPKAKREIGERLALLALAGHYGKPVQARSPSLKHMEIRGSEVVLHFDNAEGGLVARDGEPGEFSLCDAEQRWHWAQARIEGDRVILRSDKVPTPVAARYAWQANPRANLFNRAGLPAQPFSTRSGD